ncbi:MAG: hypothetical protein R6X32_05910 [Chloroflexota bacterium]
MMISPELSNPATVLHVLSYKSSLPVLIAMCMDDCPRPVKVKWLERRTGITRHTINESLIYLMESLQIVFRSGIKRASAWWLANGIRQLPLPFVQHLSDADTRPFNMLSDGQQISVGSDHRTIDGGPGRPIADHRTPDRESGQQAHLLPSSGQLNGSHHSIMVDHPPLTHVVVDHSIKDHDLVINDQQQQEPIMVENLPLSASPTRLLLRWMGVDEPLPTQFADADPAWPLSCYWYSQVCGMGNPAGYVAKRLRTGQGCPRPWAKLAHTWLSMTTENQLVLLDELADPYTRATGRISLPSDFPFVPYREVLQLYRATGGEFVPAEMMPVDKGVDND